MGIQIKRADDDPISYRGVRGACYNDGEGCKNGASSSAYDDLSITLKDMLI